MEKRNRPSIDARHIGADELVAIKVRAVLSARLADVMKQGSQAKDGIAGRRGIESGHGMMPDVEGVPLVLLDPDALEQLRPHVLQHAGRRAAAPGRSTAGARG